MTDDVVSSPAVSEPTGISFLGEVFSSARRGKKLSVKEVSNKLRLSIKQIEALENNDFAALPQAMITRGFIRNYARLLEVDAEPLLEHYRACVPDVLPGALTVKTSIHQVAITNSSQAWPKYTVSSILLLSVLLVWFIYSQHLPEQVKAPVEAVVDASTNNVASVAVALPEIALPVAERKAESVEAISPEKELATTVVAQSATAVKENVAPTTPLANPTQSVQLRPSTDVDFSTLKENAGKSAQQALVANEKVNVSDLTSSKNVSFSASEDSWVQVKDKSGKVIFEKKLAANSTDNFDGQPPFKLWIGNAKATTLTFLGQPVDLTGKTKNNVARITLE
ncbi:MAG: DUF4115 domain-containing protein [Methylotenera sp.]|nr:DUF4115 domain-containing protein [Methylotenera sp.]